MKTLADIIDLAINKYLWDGRPPVHARHFKNFSCRAISQACDGDAEKTYLIFEFMRSLGVKTEATLEFVEFEFGGKRQYARALWLTWAAMIAREEGL